MIRAAQLATLLGALGVVPAAWRAIRTWAGRRWLLAVMATLITLAFVAFTVCAVAGGLLTPDRSYWAAAACASWPRRGPAPARRTRRRRVRRPRGPACVPPSTRPLHHGL